MIHRFPVAPVTIIGSMTGLLCGRRCVGRNSERIPRSYRPPLTIAVTVFLYVRLPIRRVFVPGLVQFINVHGTTGLLMGLPPAVQRIEGCMVHELDLQVYVYMG